MGRLTSLSCCLNNTILADPADISPPSNTTASESVASFLFADRNLQLLLQIIWIISLFVFTFILMAVFIIKYTISSSQNSYPQLEVSTSMNVITRILNCFPRSSESFKDKPSGSRSTSPIGYGSTGNIDTKGDEEDPCKLPVTGDLLKTTIVAEHGTPSFVSREDELDKRLESLKEQENQRKQKMKEVEKKREESEEKHRRRRVELAALREQSRRDTIAALVTSITHPLLEETRRFNEWAEQPD